MIISILRRIICATRRDQSGVSMVEFAFVLPIMLTLGLFGTDVAWMATSRMTISQIALSTADSASRLGQTDNSSVTPTVNVSDVDAILTAALRQGSSLDIATKGRIILSSIEVHPSTGKQYIHWQRCIGALDRNSSYGDDGINNGLSGPPITGVGGGTTKITALPNSAVMFVEIFYEYESLYGNSYSASTTEFSEDAAYMIRDDRDLTPGLSGAGGTTECT